MNLCIFAVTPFVGVWIEIEPGQEPTAEQLVTPFMGVWIEIVPVKVRRGEGER